MDAATGEKRDLVLNPGEYAYLQDLTRGQIKTFVGPCVINQTAQEQPVAFSPENATFSKVVNLESAVRQAPVAREGDYLMLSNPAKDKKNPEQGNSANIPDLMHGCKVNIPGPCTFALWPSQRAEVIEGHHLRSNQFLVVRIYNEDEANRNWGKAVLKPAATLGGANGSDGSWPSG